MAPASWAHISAYCASVVAIAGVFCPKMFVATRASSRLRLAAIAGRGTVSSKAASERAAAALAWLAVCSACAAVVRVHATYGAAAAAINIDDGPSQGPAVRAATPAWV